MLREDCKINARYWCFGNRWSQGVRAACKGAYPPKTSGQGLEMPRIKIFSSFADCCKVFYHYCGTAGTRRLECYAIPAVTDRQAPSSSAAVVECAKLSFGAVAGALCTRHCLFACRRKPLQLLTASLISDHHSLAIASISALPIPENFLGDSKCIIIGVACTRLTQGGLWQVCGSFWQILLVLAASRSLVCCLWKLDRS